MIGNEGVYLSWFFPNDTMMQELSFSDLGRGWERGMELVKMGGARNVTLYSDGQIVHQHDDFRRALRAGETEPPFDS